MKRQPRELVSHLARRYAAEKEPPERRAPQRRLEPVHERPQRRRRAPVVEAPQRAVDKHDAAHARRREERRAERREAAGAVADEHDAAAAVAVAAAVFPTASTAAARNHLGRKRRDLRRPGLYRVERARRRRRRVGLVRGAKAQQVGREDAVPPCGERREHAAPRGGGAAEGAVDEHDGGAFVAAAQVAQAVRRPQRRGPPRPVAVRVGVWQEHCERPPLCSRARCALASSAPASTRNRENAHPSSTGGTMADGDALFWFS